MVEFQLAELINITKMSLLLDVFNIKLSQIHLSLRGRPFDSWGEGG